VCWLWHRLMWDRNADVDALLHDQCMTFFGPAAVTMETIYQTLSDRYEDIHWSREFDECYVPPDQMYGETYTAEAIKVLKRLFDEAPAACPKDEDNIYRRRVAWMRAEFEPFFEEADLAHRWLGKTPSYKVATVAKPPADAAGWAALPAATLVEGNYGMAPELPTKVRLARGGSDLFVRFEAAEPTEPLLWDRLALVMEAGDEERALGAKIEARPAWIPLGMLRGDPERSVAVNGEGIVEGRLPATLVSNTYAEGTWTVVLKCPAEALGIEPGQADTVEIQFARQRARREKTGAEDYYWTAPMGPPGYSISASAGSRWKAGSGARAPNTLRGLRLRRTPGPKGTET